MAFSRRDFVFLSSGAAVGNLVVSGLHAAEGAQSGDHSNSGLVTGQPKPLKHREIPGFLSAAQIAPHHTAHYGGALKAFVGIETTFEESFQRGTTIDPIAFDAMQRTKSSRGNSVILHELYFDGLAPKTTGPGMAIREAIEKRFGSVASGRLISLRVPKVPQDGRCWSIIR